MRKTALQKRKDDPNSRYWLLKADALWGEYIHLKWPGCAMRDPASPCSGKLEAHHLVSRSVRAIRHDPSNGVRLCSLHHKYSPSCSPHAGPIGFTLRLQLAYPALYTFALDNRWGFAKPNYQCDAARLQILLDRLKSSMLPIDDQEDRA